MAGNALRKVQTGQKLRIPATAYNAFVDAALANRASDSGAPAGIGGNAIDGIDVWIRNSSGADVGQFGVLGLGDALFPVETRPVAFKATLAIVGEAPTAADHLGKFAVMIEPVASGAMGHGRVAGLCACQIDVVNSAHGFAEIADGALAPLASAVSGAAQIIWKQSGTGLKWSILRLGSGGRGWGFGKITTVTGSGAGGAVTYSAATYEGTALSVTGATPINRPFGTADILPAAVNDACLLIVGPTTTTVRLIALTERMNPAACAADDFIEGPETSAMAQAGYTLAQTLDYLLTK